MLGPFFCAKGLCFVARTEWGMNGLGDAKAKFKVWHKPRSAALLAGASGARDGDRRAFTWM